MIVSPTPSLFLHAVSEVTFVFGGLTAAGSGLGPAGCSLLLQIWRSAGIRELSGK